MNETFTEFVEQQLPMPAHAVWRLKKVMNRGPVDEENALREEGEYER